MASERLNFELVTPEGVKFSEEAYEVLLPTPDGQIGLLPHHMQLVTLAAPGVISIRKLAGDADSKIEHFATTGGLIEVDGQYIRLLADTAEHSSNLDEAEAAKALAHAQELAKDAQDYLGVVEARNRIAKHLAELKTVRLAKQRQKS